MTKPGSVIGVKSTLATLKKMDETIYWQCVGEIKSAARPMAGKIDMAFPVDAPISGFAHSGRTGWANLKKTEVRFGGRRSRSNIRAQVWPLVRILVTDAPRQIFDMAGSANSGNRLDNSLKKGGWGEASRSVWRVAPDLLRDTDKAVKEACANASRKLNQRLKVVR